MTMIEFAKLAVERGVSSFFTRQDFEAEIAKRAEGIRQPNETKAQAFTRYMTDTPDGRILFAASKVAPGAEPPATEKQAPVKKRGPAYLEMDRLARAHAKESGSSYHVSFAKVMRAPGNRDLAHRVLEEERA